MPEAEQFEVLDVLYLLNIMKANKITADSLLPATSGAVYDAVKKIADTLNNDYLQKVLPEGSEPIIIDNVRYNAIEAIIAALAANNADVPIAGSNKFLTAGGAYNDKANVPTSGSSKNYTAGGAYADKAYAPEQGSVKNLTAAGAFSDKETSPVEGSTKNFTAGGAFANKSDVALQGSRRNFTCAGAYEYFLHSSSGKSWLGKLFGTMLGISWARPSSLGDVVLYGVCAAAIGNTPHYVGVSTNTDAEKRGMWYRLGNGSWNKATGEGATSNMLSVCYGMGIFVAGSYGGGFYYSTDGGLSFVHTPTAAASSLRVVAITYANDFWVAGTYSDGLWWSEDGINWTQGTSSINSAVTTVKYGGGTWMAGTEADGLYYSYDGKTWTNVTHEANCKVTALCYGAGVWNYAYTLADKSCHLEYSTDSGVNWHSSSVQFASLEHIIYDIQYANGVWVRAERSNSGNTEAGASGYPGSIYVSTSGTDWGAGTTHYTALNPNCVPAKLFYANGVWLCATKQHSDYGNTSYIFRSIDNGAHWYCVENIDGDCLQLYYAQGMWVCSARNRVIVSDVDNLNFGD